MLNNTQETESAAKCFAEVLTVGDTVLLQGPVGAGKTDFARRLIQTRQGEYGLVEDIPSPTFTLIQTYHVGSDELWHADLYRLENLDELYELGLDSAFNEAICLVEWPERLGELAPSDAIWLRFGVVSDQTRTLSLEWQAAKWNTVADMLTFVLTSNGTKND